MAGSGETEDWLEVSMSELHVCALALVLVATMY